MSASSTGSQEFIVHRGFRETDRDLVASLYWNAFGPKLGRVLGSPNRAMRMIADTLDPDHALAARASADDSLLGIAGFKTTDGGFVNIDLQALTRTYGRVGGLFRGVALQVLDRRQSPDTLLMDGIFVSAAARGLGVGTQLLHAIKATARVRGCRSVRLDVINTNPRARALYEREGFRAVRTVNLGPLRHIFGFEMATAMMAEISS
jgi:GNAT superfamily N-acetyltransferase